MAYSTYALFDDQTEATRAATEIRAFETDRDRFSVIFHRSNDHPPSSELAMFETGAAGLCVKLGLLGALFGVLVGLLAMGPSRLVGAGAFTLVVCVTVVSTVLGVMIGVVAGASAADPALKKLWARLTPEKVLLAIEASSPQGGEHVNRVLAAHHAHVVHRHLVRSLNRGERRDLEALARH